MEGSTDHLDEDCDELLDITLMLDASESIGPVGFRAIKAYSKQILDELNLSVCDNVAIIRFTDFANSETFLGTSDTQADLFRHIDALEAPAQLIENEVNKSKIDSALLVAHELVFTSQLGSRPSSKKVFAVHTKKLQDSFFFFECVAVMFIQSVKF